MSKLNDLYELYKLNPNYVNSEDLGTELLAYCTAYVRKRYGKEYWRYNDAIEDTFVRVWDTIRNGKFDGKLTTIKTWTTMVLKGKCIDLLRQGFDLVPLDEAINVSDDKEHWREEKIDLYRDIPTLSKRQQDIIQLTLEGYTQDEIAAKMNVSQFIISIEYEASIKILREKMDIHP